VAQHAGKLTTFYLSYHERTMLPIYVLLRHGFPKVPLGGRKTSHVAGLTVCWGFLDTGRRERLKYIWRDPTVDFKWTLTGIRPSSWSVAASELHPCKALLMSCWTATRRAPALSKRFGSFGLPRTVSWYNSSNPACVWDVDVFRAWRLAED
jgi:hypothetical protein